MISAWMVRLALTVFCLWYMLHYRSVDWTILVVLGLMAVDIEVKTQWIGDLRKRVKALEMKK